MANLGNIIKISGADYNTIYNAYPSSATISTGATVTYDPQAIYLISKSKKYRHNINLWLQPSKAVVGGDLTNFSFINENSSAYENTITGFNALASDLIDCGFTSNTTLCPATGQLRNGLSLAIGIYSINGGSTFGYTLYAKCIKLYSDSASSKVGTFNQKVSTLNTNFAYFDAANSWLHDTVEEI